MTPDRWQQLETLFQAALEHSPAERPAFLKQACKEDSALASEVATLLAAFDQAEGFMKTPVVESLGLVSPGAAIPCLRQGQKVAHYEIVALLGQGGMGEVYLAEDTRLRRRIALKLLSAQFMHDAQFVERFENEARSASALNHPNIITVHDIGNEAGVHFMATEFVAGETLRARLNRAPLSVEEALKLIAPITEALIAAHAAGIIHRDIKPENVMIRPDGLVKVLDFGLAKPLEVRGAAGEVRSAERLGTARFQTDPLLLMGTLRYLAPEQVRHEAVDQRTDIFSLGIVLYEMLTGRQPFTGNTTGEVLRAIQQDTPAPLLTVPSPLANVVARMLAKDRQHRYQSATELKVAIKQCRQVMKSDLSLASWRKPRALAATLLLTLLLLIAVGFWYRQRRSTVSSVVLRFNATDARKLTDMPGQELYPSLAPDGQSVIFASRQNGNWDIYHQSVGTRTVTNLTANSTSAEIQPAYSPDGKQIVFRSWNHGGGIFVMNSDGSQLTQLNDFGFNPCWSPDGREVAFADEVIWDFEGRALQSRLWAVKVASRERRLITNHDAVQPNWSPHGQRIAFWGQQKGGHRDIWTISASGGEPVPVTDDAETDWNPVWSPTGDHLYFLSNRGGEMNLWRVAIDEATGALRGAPEPATLPSNSCHYLNFARNGSALIYSQVNRTENLWQIAFDPVASQVNGVATPLTQGLKRYAHFALAPDEKTFAYLARGEPQQDLFIADLSGVPLQRLTDDAAQDIGPRWSPDSQRLAFISDRSGKYEIWQVRADGNDLVQVTNGAGENQEAVGPVWSPDGKHLYYQIRKGDIYRLDTTRSSIEQVPQRLPGQAPPGFYPWQWSPDGAYLAGWLTPTPQQQRRAVVIYSLAQQRYEELSGLGNYPVWLNDSRRLLYMQGGELYLIDRSLGQSAKPQLIYALKSPNQIGSFALTRDNRRLYFSEVSSEADLWWLSLN